MSTVYRFLSWGVLAVVLLLVGLWAGGCFSPSNGPYGKFSPADIGQCTVRTMNVEGQPTTILELMEDRLTYTAADGTEWVAPKGTLTDGASIPTFALSLTGDRFSASFLKAAIVHDAYCQGFNKEHCSEQYRKRPWRAVHLMFRDACVAGGTDVLKANLLYAAVWMCGPKWGDESISLRHVNPAYQRILLEDCKDWLGRTDRSPQQIEDWMEKRGPTIVAINDLETKAMRQMANADIPAAEQTLASAQETLDEAATKFPDDLMLQNLKGYHHKNVAILFRNAKLPQQRDAELQKAEKAFQNVIAVRSDDASALNGMGSVNILRGNLDVAEEFVDKALKIDPHYPEAKHDRALIDKIKIDRVINAAPPQ